MEEKNWIRLNSRYASEQQREIKGIMFEHSCQGKDKKSIGKQKGE